MRYRVIALVQTVRWHHNATESTEWNLWCSTPNRDHLWFPYDLPIKFKQRIDLNLRIKVKEVPTATAH